MLNPPNQARMLVFLVWLVASCSINPLSSQEAKSAGLTFEQLKNASYALPGAPGGSITLAGGKGQAPIAPDSAARFKVVLLAPAEYGDLDGDGTADAAAVLLADPGGSGSFYYLVAVLDQGGQPAHTASVLLGDRVKVKTVSVAGGKITVAYLDRGPGEPFTTEPSLEVTKVYQFQDGQLLEAVQD